MSVFYKYFPGLLIYLNMVSVRLSGKLQATCALISVSSLLMIIVCGCIRIAQGQFKSLQHHQWLSQYFVTWLTYIKSDHKILKDVCASYRVGYIFIGDKIK